MQMRSWISTRSPTEHFWSFAAKQRCSILLNNWSSWGLVLKWKKTTTTEWKLKLAPNSLSGVIQVSGSPEIQNWLNLFIVAAKLKALPRTMSEAGAQASIEDINNVLSNQFWISGLPETRIILDELSKIILCRFSITSAGLAQLGICISTTTELPAWWCVLITLLPAVLSKNHC